MPAESVTTYEGFTVGDHVRLQSDDLHADFGPGRITRIEVDEAVTLYQIRIWVHHDEEGVELWSPPSGLQHMAKYSVKGNELCMEEPC